MMVKGSFGACDVIITMHLMLHMAECVPSAAYCTHGFTMAPANVSKRGDPSYAPAPCPPSTSKSGMSQRDMS
jgi:hypothetical protein